jgi:hypothetical protein
LTGALAGLIQLVSGVPLIELSSRWNGLEAWQRGNLGTLFVLAACAVIFGVVHVHDHGLRRLSR